MAGKMRTIRCAGAVLLLLATGAIAASADSRDDFYKAYYLEHARGDLTKAAALYNDIAGDRRADSDLRQAAKARRDSIREELASADFARLVPSNTLAYIEINSPGDQLAKLIDQLGLLGKEDAAPGGEPAIRPALIRELLGVRGAAIAVTGFDPSHQKPNGVVILHPGSLEVIRGLIETALPIGGTAVDSIGGFPTYNIDDEAYVTLTNRLVIASPRIDDIEAVVTRLQGEEDESLATSPAVADALANRDDALVFFCVNFKPLMPLIKAGMALAGGQSREIAMAQAVLDIESLRTIVGRAGVSDDGLQFEFGLTLAEGHHNLAFNLFRMPGIDKKTLARIPGGSAAFFAAALNEPGSSYKAAEHDDGPPQVSLMDFGREVFANIVGVSAFVLAEESDTVIDGEQVPPAALVLTVNDVEKSKALWTQMLGIASLAAGGGGSIEGSTREIAGVDVHRYALPEGISIYFAAADDTIVISPSKTAIERSLETLDGGRSVLDDKAFADGLERVNSNSTIAAVVHAGRCLEMARPMMDEGDLRDVAPYADLIADTVVSFVMTHSDNTFRVAGTLSGIPDIGPLVREQIAAMKQHRRPNRLTQRQRRPRLTAESAAAPRAPRRVKDKVSAAGVSQHGTEGIDELWRNLTQSSGDADQRDEALATAKRLYHALESDADQLNTFAWALLTEDKFADGFDEIALKYSRRSNELTELNNWMYVDTLALAYFKLENVEKAVRLERRALELCGDDPRRGEVESTLHRFEKALKGR